MGCECDRQNSLTVFKLQGRKGLVCMGAVIVYCLRCSVLFDFFL
jgi:hypothetical protein